MARTDYLADQARNYYEKYETLRSAVELLVEDLQALGFDKDEAISGADTVDVIGQHYATLEELVAR